MSEYASPASAAGQSVTLATGLEAFRSSPEFHGPVEDLDGHDCNDHFAQIYETPAEKFEAAVPFVRHGLDRGERVAYVVDQSTEDEVRAALWGAGIDVDAALDSGALTFYSVDETYLRDGSFEADEMIQFYADATAEATEEYEALRLVAEMSWINEDNTTVEQLMEYESRINDLFDAEDVLAVCQYDRDLFAPEVINGIVRTHPHLIYDGAACHNFYYTPPEELFGDDDLTRENDRMLRTLRDRAAAKAKLQQRDRFLQDLYDVTASQDRSFEAKLDALFELGCEQFDVDFGFINRVNPAADRLEVEHASGDHEHYQIGTELPLSETYCQAAVDLEAAVSVVDPAAEGYEDLLVYEEFGVDGYLGVYVPIEGGADRTLAFVPGDDRQLESFSDQDRRYLELMGQWVQYELNHRQRERFLRECYEITADPDRGFEEKLHGLLDLAREWTDLDAAGLTRLPEWDGGFLNEYAIGYGDGAGIVTEADDLWTDPAEGCYCREVVESDEPVGKADVRGTPWEDDQIHREHGLSCYLGTKVTSGSTPYGTLWVGSTEPRERGFTETERTFLDLIGQWVSYEIERRDHNNAQAELYEITADPDRGFDEKLDALFDLGRERFGLDVGGLAKIDPETDYFGVETVRGDHDHLVPGAEYPLSETYCRLATEDGETAAVTDPAATGFEGRLCYERFGVQTYLGTHLAVDGDVDRTFWFLSNESRETPITDDEKTFVDLMGQWVQYELERQQRERELRERTDHLNALIEATPECIKTVAPDGTLLQMNAAGLEMVEAPEESAVVGENVYDLIAPEHRERFRAFNERICSGESEVLEFDIIGLGGTRRHMESHATPLERPDGTTVHVALTRDITERKERKAELERALDLLEKTERIADVGGWEFEPETGEVFWTDHLFELKGMSGDEEPSMDETIEMYHEADRPRIEDTVATALDTGESFDIEVRLGTSASNEVRWLRLQGVPETEDGEVVSIRGAVQDITERKERQAELRQTKDRFETVFEQSDDGIFLLDPDADEIVDANPAAAEMTGYTHDELLSLSASDLHPDELEQYRTFLSEACETGSAWSEGLRCRHKDGHDIPVEITASPITLDGRDLVLANVRHIGERKKHERYQRELYDIVADSRASFDEKLDRLLELGRERFGLANGYFNRVDTDADEFEVVAAVGPHDSIEPGVHDTLSGSFCETHLDSTEPLAAVDVGDAGLDYLRAHDEYGLDAYVAATVYVGGDRHGTLCFASETPRDRPFTEAERTFLDLMAQCVSYELERDHREAQLEQKNDRLESFASMLAHELRNPVNIGQIYSQQLAGDADAEAVEYVTEAFDRIEDMVDVLLILTRGREAVGERTSVDLASAARKAWDTVEAPDAVVDIELDRTIQADETYVRHLFRNLLENAVEHGGSDVTISVGDLDGVSASDASGGSTDESVGGFYVADDGAGIPPEDREAVFDEGYTTTADNGGTGLGLAFVRKLAEVYEWDVEITESEAGGARFEFRELA